MSTPTQVPMTQNFDALRRMINAIFAMLTDSGTSSVRPAPSYVGQPFFDTTLGYPVWWNGSEWVSASGGSVGSGAVAMPNAGASVSAGPGHLYSAAGSAAVIGASAEIADPSNSGYAPCNCWISGSATTGNPIVVYLPGQYVPGSFTPGATYWLSTTAEGLAATAPAAGSGCGSQVLGVADETGARFFFNPQPMMGI